MYQSSGGGAAGEALLGLSRAGVIQLVLSGVRKNRTRQDDHEGSSCVYQPHPRLRPFNPAESGHTRRGRRAAYFLLDALARGDNARVCVCVCSIDCCSYFTACCLPCSLLCGPQQMQSGRVAVKYQTVCMSIRPCGLGRVADTKI